MNWTEKTIRYTIQDMIEENPLASRAFLTISETVFTDSVPTLAVSMEERPQLKINMDFCNTHIRQENDLKAVLLHEFLHVLLLHTNKYKTNTPLLNLCLDAIINAIIHRCMGSEYSDFFARFYRWEKWTFLLRPLKDECFPDEQAKKLHTKIYDGSYSADELYELLEYLRSKNIMINPEKIVLLGDHSEEGKKIPKPMADVLEETLEKMKGVKIWNKSDVAGSGSVGEKKVIDPEKRFRDKWKAAAYPILKKCLLPDPGKRKQFGRGHQNLPVMNGQDTRAMAKASMGSIIPFFNHSCSLPEDRHTATIYLDVSGSMEYEIHLLADLLAAFQPHIKLPLYVFSDKVEEAKFAGGKLEFNTSYGTCLRSVIEHISENKIKKALVVTDGYFDGRDIEMLKTLDKHNVFFLISSLGNSNHMVNYKLDYKILPNLRGA